MEDPERESLKTEHVFRSQDTALPDFSESGADMANQSESTESPILSRDPFARKFFRTAQDSIIWRFFKKRTENGIYVNELSSKAIADYVFGVLPPAGYEMLLQRLERGKTRNASPSVPRIG